VKIRLNKFLAASGVASRRAADALIARGAVAVNGKRADLGASIDPASASVTVHGRRIYNDPFRDQLTLVLNKPAGVITTMRDERGRKTVAQLLPHERRLFPVGRLDAQTTGVLLCTTDGTLARELMHPSREVPKRYEVVARGNMSPEVAAALGATNVRQMADGAQRFAITLTEGKNRQVRRMCARSGLRVVSLERTQFGPVHLGKLKAGCTRSLTTSEARELERVRAERSVE
jgi:23S rRNA pseudouridine2605 synthase